MKDCSIARTCGPVALLLLALAIIDVAAVPALRKDHITSTLNAVARSDRQARWFMDTIRNMFPSRASISNRVSDTFSRNSFDEAVSVILPQGAVNPMKCPTADDDIFHEGVCMRVADCMYYGGTSYGSCAGVLGSCCVAEKRCDQNSNLYVTQFTNPRYPTATSGTGECKLTVNPMHSNICQYRLDFDDLNIAQPDKSSNCVTDFLGVTGGTSVPKMCGDLTGQHVYINVKPGAGIIELSMDTAITYVDSRTWNIKVTQIACDSPDRAPAGCIQFHNKTSGTIKSLNFNSALPEELTTRQLRRHNYGVCINSKVGYCELTWTASESGSYSFTVSGDATVPKEKLVSLYGPVNCTKDYVTIAGGIYEDADGNPHHAERYCGTKFPARVRTKHQPYRMHVHTDNDEEGDVQNAGFAINFRHSLC